MSAPKRYTTVLRKSERWLKGERPVAEVTQGERVLPEAGKAAL